MINAEIILSPNRTGKTIDYLSNTDSCQFLGANLAVFLEYIKDEGRQLRTGRVAALQGQVGGRVEDRQERVHALKKIKNIYI